MNNKIYGLVAGAALLFGAASCSENWNPPTEEEGSVSLASMGLDVSNLEKVITASVGSGSRASMDVSNFLVKIYDSREALAGSWKYADMPEIVTLPADSYRVDIESHEIEKAQWDAPYFCGSKEFEVTAGKITSLGVVTCKFASLKVSIKFTDDLRNYLGDDTEVSVVANDEGRLVYTPAETRSGYFEVIEGSTTLVVTFNGTVNGNAETVRKVYTDVEPGQHRIITYDVKTTQQPIPDETGQIDPSNGISLDISVTDEDLSGNVTVEEEPLPDEPRPGEWPEEPETPVIAQDVAASDVTSNSVVLRGTVAFDNVESVGFNYRQTGTSAWQYVEGVADSRTWAAGATFSATITGLDPSTVYEYTVTADDYVSDVKTFTTAKEAGKEAATFSSDVFDLQAVNKVSEIPDGARATVHIDCPAGIAHLVVTIDSPSLTPDVLSSVGLLSTFDLAYPDSSSEPGGKDLTAALGGLGFPVGAEVIGSTSLDFDITDFLSLLGIYGRYEHSFIIAVTDANGLMSTCTLIIDSDV